MNKTVRIIIPIVALALFIAIMTTGALLKKPISNEDDLIYFIEKMESEVLAEDWSNAADHLKDAKKAWKRIVRRVQFSAERDEINELHKTLDRTDGFIKAKDKGGAMAELAEARNIWKELGK